MLINNKKPMRALIALAIPALIEYILQSTLSYADYIMVGRLGINASAAIGLTQEINFLLKGVLMAAGIGVVSYISNAMGKQQFREVKRAAVQAFFISGFAGIVLLVVALPLSPALPVWMGADKAIRADASSFFRIIYLPVIFTSYNMILSSVLKGVGDMKTSMYVNVFVNILNIILNYLLIYESRTVTIAGLQLHVWGAGLGVRGSATGTAISSVIGGAAMIIAVLRNPLTSPIGEKLASDRAILRKFVSISTPVLLNRVTTSFGRILFTSFVTALGTMALAAHTVAFTAESAFYMAVVGMQTAVTTLAGMYRGEGSGKKLHRLAVNSCCLVAGLMAVTGILMILLAKPIISLFTSDPGVIDIGARLFLIVAINEPVFGMSIIMEGIFNGTGDTKSPFLISMATLWIVRVLGTWVAIRLLGFGIYGAWICMISENTARCLALLIRYNVVKNRMIPTETAEC